MQENKEKPAAEQGLTKEMLVVLEKAQQGDEAVLPQLRQLLDSQPALWRQFGDFGWHAEQVVLSRAGGKNLLMREASRRRLDELKAELAGASSSPVERLLANRVALAWADVHAADVDLAEARKKSSGGRSVEQAQRNLDWASNRFLEAARALATV